MTEQPTARLGFTDALHRAWVAAPVGTVRSAFAAFGALVMLGIHVLIFAATGEAWSLLAVPVLPVAAYLLLWGYLYQRHAWRALGLLLFVLGAMVPFYLA